MCLHKLTSGSETRSVPSPSGIGTAISLGCELEDQGQDHDGYCDRQIDDSHPERPPREVVEYTVALDDTWMSRFTTPPLRDLGDRVRKHQCESEADGDDAAVDIHHAMISQIREDGAS